MKKPQSYQLKPARGQALLSYQNRLTAAEMPLFETECVEQVRPNGQKRLGKGAGRNLLLQGDCLSACAYMKKQRIAADLVYIDPPFASGANYAKKIFLRGGAELDAGEASIGEELMYGDIWQKEDYLNWLYERLLAIREIMSENASIYVHLDWHIGHYAKVMMDEVFGEENFRNEIVWHYRRWTAPGRGYQNMHDVILFYGKGEELIFNRVEVEPTESKRKAIARGYHTNVIASSQGRVRQILVYDQDKVAEKVRNGTLDLGKYDKVVPVDAQNVVAPDVWEEAVWADIQYINSQSLERTGYITQKPEALLHRIISASSSEGMTVADFFSGSGTTAKMAYDLKRRFIACDIGINAIQTTRDRLRETGAEFDHLKIRDGVRLFRNPEQTREKVFALMPNYQPRAALRLGEFWDGGIVTDQGRCTPVVFLGIDQRVTRKLIDTVLEEASAVADEGSEAEAAIIVYASKAIDVDQDYAAGAARRSRHSEVRVRLLSLDELLGEKIGQLYAPDSAEVTLAKSGGAYRVTIHAFFSPYLKIKIDEHNARRKQARIGKKGVPIQISDNGLELIESVQFDTSPPRKGGAWISDKNLEDKPNKRDKVKGVYEPHTDKFRLKIRNIAGDEIVLDSSGLPTADRRAGRAME